MDNRFRSAALAQAQGRLDAAEAAYRALLADDAENAAAIRANLAAIAVARGDGAAADVQAILDNVWVLIATVLVIFMNAGFVMVHEQI